MNVLFLDVDGVLNAHEYDPISESTRLDPRAVALLNEVVDAHDLKLVITSAWRYLVHSGAMTVRGFEHLLQSHHVHAKGRVLGITEKDVISGRVAHERVGNVDREELDRVCRSQRVDQIGAWIAYEDAGFRVRRFAIVDDLDLPFMSEQFATRGIFVRTDGSKGLQRREADALSSFFGADVAS